MRKLYVFIRFFTSKIYIKVLLPFFLKFLIAKVPRSLAGWLVGQIFFMIFFMILLRKLLEFIEIIIIWVRKNFFESDNEDENENK
jgi:hypothetical protein